MTGWRILAQRALTRQWLHTDVEAERAGGPSWELSGVGTLSLVVEPELLGGLTADDGRPLFEEWSTLIYVEQGGVIRWGGIVVDSRFQGQSLQVEVASFATYPHGMPYTGAYSSTEARPDSVIVGLWGQLQSEADSDLGVFVTRPEPRTPVRLGSPAQGKDGDDDYVEADPYELFWWDAPDTGSEIDQLLAEGDLSYTEHHRWNADKSDVLHEIRVHYPASGRKRTDLAFRLGENILGDPEADRDGDEFANSIIGIGAGEGKGSLRRSTAIRDGRLRRTAVHVAKDVASASRLSTQMRRELATHRKLLTVPSITVMDHPNARISSWQLGDDILVQTYVPHVGDVSIWHRVLSWALNTDDTATLTLARSDGFSV